MNKLTALLQSRKFWALITSLVTIAGGVYTHQLPYDQAALLVVGALSAYTIGTAVEDHGQAIAAQATGGPDASTPPRG